MSSYWQNVWNAVIGKSQPKDAVRERPKRVQKPFLESIISNDFWLSQYVDFLSRYQDGVSGYPINNPGDRKHGSNYPFWYSEQQLGMIRAKARLLTTTNPNAIGLLNGMCSYVIGAGYNYRVTPKAGVDVSEQDIHDCQSAIEEFKEINYWDGFEEEIFKRTRVDGECFIRKFVNDDGMLVIRPIEPEWVTQPQGETFDEWSYGIKTKKDDVMDPEAYFVDYAAPLGESEADKEKRHSDIGVTGEEVSAEKIEHIKINVPFTIKRGVSDFSFETLDSFQMASKLRKNLGEGASVQSAIAAVRQHETADSAQVEAFVDEMIDFSVINAPNSKQTDYQQFEPGTFLDIPKGMQYVAPPGASNAKDHLEIFQALLRSAGNRHNAPEWLSSANTAGSNYASSLTAESPFLRNCVRMQRLYRRHFRSIIIAAVKVAAEFGKIRKDILDLVDIVVTPPAVEARDKIADASANDTYFRMRVKSPQTISQEIGVNFEAEQRNFEQVDEAMANSDLPPDGSDLKDSSLDGKQGENLTNLAMMVATGKLPPEVARGIATATYPAIDESVIGEMFPDSLYKTVEEAPPPAPFGGGNGKGGNKPEENSKNPKDGGGLQNGKAKVKGSAGTVQAD